MRRTTFALILLPSAPLACAEVTSSSSEEPSATLEGSGGQSDGDEEIMDGSGGRTVVVGTADGGTQSMGGTAPSAGGSTSGGSTGPVLLPSCSSNSECSDDDPCTDDTCTDDGQCSFTDNGVCECTEFDAAVSCDDDNPCTDESCVDHLCINTNNTASCTDDDDACTSDVCDMGACTHVDAGLCSANTVTLRSVRDGYAGQWISVNGAGLLVWNVSMAAGEATLFEREEVTASTFRLLAPATGLYVILDGNDDLAATGVLGEAAVFSTSDCPLGEDPGFGIEVTTDDDGTRFLAAEPGGELKARSGGCSAASATAWERFDITSAAP